MIVWLVEGWRRGCKMPWLKIVNDVGWQYWRDQWFKTPAAARAFAKEKGLELREQQLDPKLRAAYENWVKTETPFHASRTTEPGYLHQYADPMVEFAWKAYMAANRQEQR